MSYDGIVAGWIESLPPSLAASFPVALPPPGVTPDFDHPFTLFPIIITVLASLSFFAAASYAIRIYMRVILLKKWRWDDTMITLGLIFTVLYLSAVISGRSVVPFILSTIDLLGSAYGIFGVHLYDIHMDRAFSKVSLYSMYMSIVMFAPAIGFIKLALLLQFYYLFKPLRWLRLSCWIGGGIIALVYFGISIVAFTLCSPWPGEDILSAIISWHCHGFELLSIPTGVVSLVSDLFLLILPIPAIASLHMVLRKKIGVLLVFALGTLAVIGSAIGIYYRYLFYLDANSSEADAGWNAGYIAIWTQVEILSGILIANMHVVNQFFVRKNIIDQVMRKVPTAFSSFQFNTRRSKSIETNNTYTLEASIDSQRNIAQPVAMESNLSKMSDKQNEPYLGTSYIMVHHDYSVTSQSV